MLGRSAIVAALIFAAPNARADSFEDRAPREWDERRGWQTEVSVGNGVGFVADRGMLVDTTIRIGFHKVRDFDDASVLGLRAPGLAWCMPVMLCGGAVGMFFGPAGAFVGNEVGLDVAAHVLHGVSGSNGPLGFAFGVRPALRVARESRFRTASFLGSLLPEVGLAVPGGRSHEAYFELGLYPVAATVTRDVAIEWEVLRERIGVPLDGAPATVTVSTALSIMLL